MRSTIPEAKYTGIRIPSEIVKKPRGSFGFDKKITDLATSPAKVPQKSRNGFLDKKENNAKSLI